MKIAYILNEPFIIEDNEYIAFREEIKRLLLTFFDEITSHKDPAFKDEYISFVGRKDRWVAVSVYHAKEYYDYWKAGELELKITERISVITGQYLHTLVSFK